MEEDQIDEQDIKPSEDPKGKYDSITPAKEAYLRRKHQNPPYLGKKDFELMEVVSLEGYSFYTYNERES